jgi:glycosyltransferase involved in cell wall biosynthesis
VNHSCKPRILTFSSLFPNSEQPAHGVFVENRLRFLAATDKVSVEVIAPVPWFPSERAAFGRYAQYAKVPELELRNGIRIHHPRFPAVPKLGMSVAPLLMFLAVRPALLRLLREGYDFDLIDAHYFYPDGVAAVLLGRACGKPVTITARGTDINLIPQFSLPRRQIIWAAKHAAGLAAVCQALKDQLVSLGAQEESIRVLRNGVDLDLFQPVDRRQARAELGLATRTLVSIGNLVPLKGHDLVIRATHAMPDTTLLLVGEGSEYNSLLELTRNLQMQERVRFLGRMPYHELPAIYSAADALVLASSREGWPNVLLEAMACGTPVVATNVSGTGEIVTCPAAGVLMKERSAEGVVEGVNRLFSNVPQRDETRAYAEGFSWDAPTEGQLLMFQQVLASNSPNDLINVQPFE